MYMQYITRKYYFFLLSFHVVLFSIYSQAYSKAIDVIEIDDPITPVVAEFIIKSIVEAEAASSECIIIQMDTPGGLDLAMREIIKEILSSEVPVVVYVSPSGARAASAGAIIAMAAHIAARTSWYAG